MFALRLYIHHGWTILTLRRLKNRFGRQTGFLINQKAIQMKNQFLFDFFLVFLQTKWTQSLQSISGNPQGEKLAKTQVPQDFSLEKPDNHIEPLSKSFQLRRSVG